MQYVSYKEYVPAKSSWLKEVPKGWTESKFGFVKKVLTDYTANGSFADLKSNIEYIYTEDYARLVRLTDLRKNLEADGVWVTEKAYKFLGKSALFGGEFLLANVGAYAGLFCQMPYINKPATLAPNMFMARFEGNKVCEEFMAYVGQSDQVVEHLRLRATGSSAQPKLNKDDFKSVVFAYPTIAEQQKIAAFLDYKTQQIDQLIKKKKALIEKLEEKRIAVITQAVTKGLDKNVTLKPSGMDWLGDVPDHWLSSSLRWLGKRYAGGTPDKSKDEYWVGGTIPWLNSGAVNQGDINTPSAFITEEAYNSSSTKWVPESAIVLALAGQGKTKGTAAYMKINATCNQSMAAIVFDDKYYSRFMYWWLVSQYKNIRGMASDDGRDGLNLEMIGSIPCPIPTLDEQVEIAFYIDEFEKKRKKILEKLNSAVEKLDEYRSAIITSAVTGKIDVRNVGIPREAA